MLSKEIKNEDGIHVSLAMLRLALRGAGCPIPVTDAMPAGWRLAVMVRAGGRNRRGATGEGRPMNGTGICLDVARGRAAEACGLPNHFWRTHASAVEIPSASVVISPTNT